MKCEHLYLMILRNKCHLVYDRASLVGQTLKNLPTMQETWVQFLGQEDSPGEVYDKDVISSVQFSHSVVSDSLWPHKPQHARPPCPSPTPGVYPDSCPLSQWCHPAISSSVVPFFSCPQPLPVSGSFLVSQLFAWGGQRLEFQLQHQSFQWTPRTYLL